MPCLMRTIYLLLAAAFLHHGAHAQDADAAQLRKAMEQTPANTFRYIGNDLVCKQDTPAQNYLACLSIGPLRVGDSYRPMRDLNPKPWKEVALENGVSAAAFLIIATAELNAYWVIGHRDDKIVSVQLTGNYSHPDLAFATIRLNDSEEKVLAMLGPRAQIWVVREIGGLLWDYYPFPISIEFLQGRVYSMRVTAPDLTAKPAPQGGAADAGR